jgi:hypothetical protein
MKVMEKTSLYDVLMHGKEIADKILAVNGKPYESTHVIETSK